MEYRHIVLEELNAEIRLASFAPCQGVRECHALIELKPQPESFTVQAAQLGDAYADLKQRLAIDGLLPMAAKVFLSDPANQDPRSILGDDRIPLSVIGQAPLNGTKAALLVSLCSDLVSSVYDDGVKEWRHNGYRHLWRFGEYLPEIGSEIATEKLLDKLSVELERKELSLCDNCVRTWFYVRDIDRNYPGVVLGRNKAFERAGLTNRTHFIASTGIEGVIGDKNTDVVMDAYSIGGLDKGQMNYLYAPEKMNRTSEYGVSFERGTTVDYGDRRHIFLSGTASIDNHGEIVCTGNISGQTRRMLENVESLLVEAGARWSDVAHMIVYLRDPADYLKVNTIFRTLFPRIPKVFVKAAVCRPGWLIEMECMAITACGVRRFRPL